ncbi:50S ribosomal protein L34e [Candidatus Woesearchaeota archaeon]|nr:50S ribosomal protein L34e [Candidatus Woesearchaeota archaeon]
MHLNEGRQKSRSLRRLERRTPKGRVVVHYIQKNPSKARCAGCGKVLHGVSRTHSNKLSKLSKSERGPSRPHSGQLCSFCSRNAIINKYRNLFSLSKK